MARRYRRTRNSDAGFERAKQHIREARELSAELGGTDTDVKEWFFKLAVPERNKILEKYEAAYGQKAADYARKTIPKWKSGATQMSGMVASRLFSLLPPLMPIQEKFGLVDTLWLHVAPKRKRLVKAGLDTPVDEVVEAVEREVKTLSTDWRLPAQMKKRFEWLSQSDSATYEELLAHLKHQERTLAEEVLRTQIPQLKAKFDEDLNEATSRLSYIVELGKQSVELRISQDIDTISAGEWTPEYASSRGSDSRDSSLWAWIGGGLFALWLLSNF